MSDTTDTPAAADAKGKKKGKLGKMLIGGVALLVLVGGGVGAGVYASSAGLIGVGHGAAADDGKPKLVPKSEQKPASAEGEGGGHAEDFGQGQAHRSLEQGALHGGQVGQPGRRFRRAGLEPAAEQRLGPGDQLDQQGRAGEEQNVVQGHADDGILRPPHGRFRTSD